MKAVAQGMKIVAWGIKGIAAAKEDLQKHFRKAPGAMENII